MPNPFDGIKEGREPEQLSEDFEETQDPVQEEPVALEPEIPTQVNSNNAMQQVKIVRVPNSLPDPMGEGFTFILGGWAYQCYGVKDRGRKQVRRLGMVQKEG